MTCQPKYIAVTADGPTPFWVEPSPELRTIIDERFLLLITADVDLDAGRISTGACPNGISFEDGDSIPRMRGRCDQRSAEAHDAGTNDRKVINLVHYRVSSQEMDKALRISLPRFSK